MVNMSPKEIILKDINLELCRGEVLGVIGESGGAVWMQGSPFNVTTWNMRPTANIMMTLAYKSDSNWNETFWESEKFDKTLVEVHRGRFSRNKEC